jgi:hypothetical protein
MTQDELKRQALLIAAQLPPEREAALRILSYAGKVIQSLEDIGEREPAKTRAELRVFPGSSEKDVAEGQMGRRDRANRG